VPAGLTDDGRPVGLQLVGDRYDDDVVLAASAAVERERPWDDHYPD
jgi:Asp-tRNA(Asn)/Glu-tRNA(Gln) amidotransferase A subunit family amidase